MIKILYFFVFLLSFFSYGQSYKVDLYYDTREKVIELIKTNNDSSKIIIDQFINSKNNTDKAFGYFLKSCEYYFDEDLEKFNKNILRCSITYYNLLITNILTVNHYLN